jgi:RimJ/RimL family protein N-acetyltransferase
MMAVVAVINAALTVEDKRVALQFLKEHGVILLESSDFNALGRFTADRKLIGVVGYNGFNAKVCSMHSAGDGNWVSREFLRDAFHYPFVTCDVNVIIGTVAGDNARALKFNKHLGFEVLFRLKDGWENGIDMVVMGMSKQSCRWLTQEQKHELQAA